jgi:hypothetical protein
MEQLTNLQSATPESVWAYIQETHQILRESGAKTTEMDRILTEKFAETDRRMRETDRQIEKTSRQMEDTDRRMKELQKEMGGWSNNHGSYTEAYFYDCFENGKKNFFGEEFDKIERNIKGLKTGAHDEYDIVLFNGKSVSIIEVQFKAKKEHLVKLYRKAYTFRENFPDYRNHKVYLGFASQSFYNDLKQECIANGIAVIKQKGETIIINDEHLKVY